MLGWLITLPFVFLLAGLNAYENLTEDLSRVGFNLFNLALVFVLLSYFSGLGVRLVQSMVEGAFICFGWDPEESYWDELITLLLTGPVLVFVYKNSVLSATSDAVAGIGPLVIAKVVRRLVHREPEIEQVLPVVWPDALIRNMALSIAVAVLGGLSCCCGSFSSLVTPAEPAPVRMTVAELEKQGLPGKRKWLELTDGYLFWPRLVQAPKKGGAIMDFRWNDCYFVPLVSRDVLDEWLVNYRRDGEKANYSFARCKAIAVFHAKDFARTYPDVARGQVDPKRPFAQITLLGEAKEYKGIVGIPDAVRTTFAAGAHDIREEELIVVEKDSQPVGRSIWVIALLIGVLALLPLGIRLLMGWPRRRPKILQVVPVRKAPPPWSQPRSPF